MDIGVLSALLATVVGVVGTLMSALLTQRAADRSRQRELARAGEVWDRRAEAQGLWSCYVALNTSGRHYLAALTDQLCALGREAELPSVRQRLTAARDQHREVYAEAQMRLPDRVLDHMRRSQPWSGGGLRHGPAPGRRPAATGRLSGSGTRGDRGPVGPAAGDAAGDAGRSGCLPVGLRSPLGRCG